MIIVHQSPMTIGGQNIHLLLYCIAKIIETLMLRYDINFTWVCYSVYI